MVSIVNSLQLLRTKPTSIVEAVVNLWQVKGECRATIGLLN